MTGRRVAATALWCVACSAPQNAAVAPRMTADEARAVHLAEELLLNNGYGMQAADRTVLELDAVERVSVEQARMPLEQLLSLRHNTVCFPAYGISHWDAPRRGWTVYFRPTRELNRRWKESTASEPLGRGVEVSDDFSLVRLIHMDARLRTAQKVLHPSLDECPVAGRRTKG